MGVYQHWFGHKAAKATLLYIVGVSPKDIPDFQLRIDEPTHVVGSRKKGRPEISKADREHSPICFAKWLVDIARKVEL